jgi:hypothetical protein
VTTVEPHVARTTKAKPDRCRDCGQAPVVSEVHHPRAATLHLGGSAWAHQDLAPLVRDLFPRDDPTKPRISRHPENPRRGDHDAIVKSVINNGVYTPPKVQVSTGYVLAGNHSFDAVVDCGATRMPWVWLDVDDREARRIMADDNRTAELGGYDQAMLLENLRALDATGDLALTAWRPEDLALYETLSDLPIDMSGQVNAEDEFGAAGIEDLDNQDNLAAYWVRVNFADESDLREFCRLLDIKRPRKRMWFPEVDDLIESETEFIALPEESDA